MASSADRAIKTLFQRRGDIETALHSSLERRGTLPLYGMLGYFMGYADEALRASNAPAGKRIRSSFLLTIADMFGGAASAMDLALAVEFFHNFTLIHDDIEDHDELRRGRPTVWKLWGVNHGINAGDALAFITTHHLLAAGVTQNGLAASQLLNQHFIQVAEGQYLDFELTNLPLSHVAVSIDAYLEMVRKKTSVLIGAAVAAGGVAAGCTPETRDLLYRYGESLGMAYQIADDMASVWGEEKETGKTAQGDILERKKTFPVLFTRDQGANANLVSLYEQEGPLSQSQVMEVLESMHVAGAREATRKAGESYVRQAKQVTALLPISDEDRETLTTIVEALVQFPPMVHVGD